MPRSLFYLLSLLSHLLLVVGYMHTSTSPTQTTTIVIEPLPPANERTATGEMASPSPNASPSNHTDSISTTTTKSTNTASSNTPSPTNTSAGTANTSAPATTPSASDTSPISRASPPKSRAAKATIQVVKRSCSKLANNFKLKGGTFTVTATVNAAGKASAVSFARVADKMMNDEIRQIAMDMTFTPALDDAGQATAGQAVFTIIHADCR